MFDLAWSELLVIGLVAVLVLGPKELPQAMRTLARAIRKVRNLGSEFQGHFNEMLREAELEEVRKQIQKFSPANITETVTNMVDPQGEIAKQVQSTFQDPDAKPLNPDPAPGTELSGPAQDAPTGLVAAVPGTPDVDGAAPPVAAPAAPAEPAPAEPKPPAAP